MKSVVSDIEITKKIQQFQSEMKGVFSVADLYNLIGANNPIANQRAIGRLVNSMILSRVKRGLYVSSEFDLWNLAIRINQRAYISMDSVLSKNGLVGSLSMNRVSLVSTANGGTIQFDNYRIDLFSINQSNYFGFYKDDNGISIADNEKAFIDILFFYMRGYKFAFDPRNEVNINKLERKKIEKYLTKYKNPKFTSFVKGVIDER